MASGPLLTPDEAAARLHVSERTLRDLKRKGAVRYVAVSARRVAYRADDLDEYIDSRVRQAEPAVLTPPKPKLVRQHGRPVPFSEQVGQ